MIFPAWRDWAFAIKIFGAAVLALFLALWIDLPHPYWSVSTVFITSQLLAGATRSKALYRVYGTLLGALAAVVLVPNLINAPELLTLAIALWVSVCLYFSLLDRTPKSYILMLGGYTTAFIGFPAVAEPASIFDTAVARAEEITIGILCASVAASIVLPQSVAPLVKCRLDQWFRDMCGWSASVLGRFGTNDSQVKPLRLACDAIALDALLTPLRYDMSGTERSAEAMAILGQDMLMFLPVVSAIADRIETSQRTRALPVEVQRSLNDMAAWVASGTIDPFVADQLRRTVADVDPVFDQEPQWTDLMVASLAAHLKDFIDLRQDAGTLQRHIVDGTPVKEALAFRYSARARSIRHRDHGIALLSAISAFLAILLASAIWIATGWSDGSSAPMLAAVGCSLFAAQDDPAPRIIDLANSAIIGAVGAAAYLFAVLPAATSFEMLALALAPGLFACGLLMTQPRTALIGMGTAVIGFTLLALQDSYSGDFMSFADTAIAVIAGIWIAAIVTRLVRSVEGAWSARRLRRINRTSLAEVALQQDCPDGLQLAALMLDRVGLIVPRLAALPPNDAEWTAELLHEVQVGIDLVELLRVRGSLSREAAGEIDQILSAVGQYFKSDAAHPTAELIALVDACLDVVAANERELERRGALLGLIDLRRGLFPNAAPYRASGPSILEPRTRCMTSELNIHGVFVPALFAWTLIAFGFSVPLRRILACSGFYRFVWHRPLFDIGLYVVLLGAIVFLAVQFW